MNYLDRLNLNRYEFVKVKYEMFNLFSGDDRKAISGIGMGKRRKKGNKKGTGTERDSQKSQKGNPSKLFFKTFRKLGEKEQFQRYTVDKLKQIDPLYMKTVPESLLYCFTHYDKDIQGDGGVETKFKQSPKYKEDKKDKEDDQTFSRLCTKQLGSGELRDLEDYGMSHYFVKKEGGATANNIIVKKKTPEIVISKREKKIKEELKRRKPIQQVVCRCAKGKSHIPKLAISTTNTLSKLEKSITKALPNKTIPVLIKSAKPPFQCRTKHFSRHYSRTYTNKLERNRDTSAAAAGIIF